VALLSDSLILLLWLYIGYVIIAAGWSVLKDIFHGNP